MSAVFALDSLLHNDETFDLIALTWDRTELSRRFAVEGTIDSFVCVIDGENATTATM